MLASAGWNSENRIILILPRIFLDIAGGGARLGGFPPQTFPLRIFFLEAGITLLQGALNQHPQSHSDCKFPVQRSSLAQPPI